MVPLPVDEPVVAVPEAPLPAAPPRKLGAPMLPPVLPRPCAMAAETIETESAANVRLWPSFLAREGD